MKTWQKIEKKSNGNNIRALGRLNSHSIPLQKTKFYTQNNFFLLKPYLVFTYLKFDLVNRPP